MSCTQSYINICTGREAALVAADLPVARQPRAKWVRPQPHRPPLLPRARHPPPVTRSLASREFTSSNSSRCRPDFDCSAFPSNFYAAEVTAAAAQISDATTKAKALSVAKIPSFTWLDTASKVPILGQLLGNASALQKSSGTKQLVEFIVYDLPDRDCAAAASNGEYSYATGGAAQYEA